MMKPLRKIIAKIAPAVAVLLMVVGFSAFHARRACDEIVRSEIAPPPRYSTRFVLHPSRYMGGADELGFKPGWVVTYAPRSREYGTAIFVSFFGKMLARGTPTIVGHQHKQDEMTLEKFRDGFAQLDAAVQEGGMFSTVEAALGSPHASFTNDDGSLSVFYTYMTRSLTPVDWLTNGFSLIVSNGIVVRKGYSYTSSR
jgi:hypothetical protein